MELRTLRRRVRKNSSNKIDLPPDSDPDCPATDDLPTGSFAVTPRQGWYLPLKAAVEFLPTCVLLILTSPILLLAAILVKLTSRGPAIYKQTRVGKDGRLYTIFKLRTMRHDCE